MNRDQAREWLADYLGDELDDAQRHEFEAYLAGDAELTAEVEDLRRALATLRTLDEPAAGETAPWRSARSPRLLILLRYAAVIALAFGAGYLTSGRFGLPTSALTPTVVQPPAGGATDAWEKRVAVAYANESGRSGLARSLVALAHATRHP